LAYIVLYLENGRRQARSYYRTLIGGQVADRYVSVPMTLSDPERSWGVKNFPAYLHNYARTVWPRKEWPRLTW